MNQPLDDIKGLPSADTVRWVIRRKAQVVAAVNRGLITVEEVMKRYGISEEEYRSWERSLKKHGLSALKATKVQVYRDLESLQDTRSNVQRALNELQQQTPE